jgi:hypothetical protein
MVHPIFKDYTVMDNIVKGMVKEMPIERGEIIYLMELDKQKTLFTTMLLFSACGSALCILLTWV